MKRLSALLLAAALLLGLLTGCGKQPPATPEGPQRYSTIYFDVFDTVTQIIAYCDTDAEFQTQTAALHDDLAHYHRLFDIYNDYAGVNNLKTVNDNAGIAPVKVEAPILDLLELSKQIYTETGGRTNVAMGSVLRLWHNARTDAGKTESTADNRLPDPEALAAAAQHCDIDSLILDREAGTVYLADPEMRLDVGSIGKGYATELACRAAEARGLTCASVSVGGNLRSMGKKPGNLDWTGGVENPWNSSEVYTGSSSLVDVLNASDLALVTSGDYQRYYVVDGEKYHHLIDPATLYPARYCSSVTVLCPDSGRADGYSTGLFCMPVEEGLVLVESLPDVEALWCLPDGTTVTSGGWAAHRYSRS